MIGIIFPMQEEIDAIKKYFILKNTKKIYELYFLEGTINNKEVVLVKCGVGKVNAARTAQLLIDNYNIKCVINMGVAGGIDSRLNILDLVIGTSFVQYDFDITVFNHRKGYIPNLGDMIYNNNLLNDIAYKTFSNSKYKIFKGTIASGDMFITDRNMSNRINSEFNALCVEMESSAIAQVCHLCEVPYLIVRSISDVPGKDNSLTYIEFLEKSCEVVADFVFEILNNI